MKSTQKITVDEANKRIANMENELAMLKKIVNGKNREPMKLSYSVDELVDGIINNTINELVVGDYIDITLMTSEKVRMYVIGKRHDELVSGNKADYTFGILNLDMRYRMNDKNTNEGGWTECKMRNVFLPRIKRLLPHALLSNLAHVLKTTSAGNGSSKIVVTPDDLFCLSEIEYLGKPKYSHKGEGSQYEFFAKNIEHELGWYPWLRSPYYGNSSYFCYVDDGGSSDYSCANYSYGVAFGFCLTSKI